MQATESQIKERLLYFLQGNQAAVDMCMAVLYIAHLWDDLIDRDKVRTPNEISQAFILALVGIPGNSFYDQHRFLLQPVFSNAILQWLDSNALERSPEIHDRRMAWMLRASILQIFNYSAFLIGGFDWYQQVGPDMRKLYQENFNDFNEEMKNA